MTTSSKGEKKEKLDFTEKDVIKIKRQLRAIEYYEMQSTFDNLYTDSKNGKKFKNLMKMISSKKNILLAYRTLKKNNGGKTPGVDGKTIDYLKNMKTDELVKRIQDKLKNYQPKAVKRVYIPKANGKLRPLGIPCIEDRLVQQCIKQILEPICEAKFHPHSYGFRPDRKAEDAISTFMRNMNIGKCSYVVDVDIKGFFDNVNHAKLLKQIWSLGIQDKSLIAIIKKCLIAPIEEERDGKVTKEYPTKGTPQGGVLSPLLANIVLNELDWWISSQWMTFKAKDVKVSYNSNGSECTGNKYRALRKSNLKEGYLVRYADDFKICCKTKEEAERWFHATTQWLNDRLSLEYAPDKSKVTNLKKSSSEFLGLRFKLKRKGNKWVINSWMTRKAIDNMKKDIIQQISKIQKNRTMKNVQVLNAKILGRHNYYRMATHINQDMGRIHFDLSKRFFNRLNDTKIAKTKHKGKNKYDFTAYDTYNKFYSNYNYKPIVVCGLPIFPIGGITTKTIKCFNQKKCRYTEEGRAMIHKNLECVNPEDLSYLMKNPIENMSAEYNDNRISLFTAQWGACGLTGFPLSVDKMDCHHKLPKSKGGKDNFNNLILLDRDSHKLIHATNKETITHYLKIAKKKIYMQENAEEKLKRFYKTLNTLRRKVGNTAILDEG